MRKRLFALVIAFLTVSILSACSDEMPSNSPTQTISLVEEEVNISDIEDVALSNWMSDLVVHFLDVGQGDSIFIELPNGQNMLIDGGESSSAKAIQDYLLSKNVSTIDYLIATHPHEDHIGGLPAIIDSFDIESVYMPRVSHTTKTFEKLLTSIDNKGLQIDIARADVNILTSPDLKIDIIAPVRDDYSDLNNHSAVIRIIYGDTGFLFMGDAEELSEGHITADVSVDVLKAGHHGSDTSTSQAFLDKVAPIYAVISVGSRNSYNHPADETLKRLNDADIYVYRTDLQGTLVFTSDGGSITANTGHTPYQTPAPESTLEPTPEPTPEPPPEPTPEPKPEPTPDPIPELMPEPELMESPAASDVFVWLSATGSKYHRINNCGRMNPDKARQVTLEEAKKSYEPCSNCGPPK